MVRQEPADSCLTIPRGELSSPLGKAQGCGQAGASRLAPARLSPHWAKPRGVANKVSLLA